MKLRFPHQEQFKPLCVDLDKTLVNQDVFRKTLLTWIGRGCKPLNGWPPLNRTAIKDWLYLNVDLNSINWTLNDEVIKLIEKSRMEGKPIILITGNSRIAVEFFASKHPYFSLILSSNTEKSLKGRRKLQELERLYEKYNFDYVADSIHDIPVWKACNQAYIVRNKDYTLKKILSSLTRTYNLPIVLNPNK